MMAPKFELKWPMFTTIPPTYKVTKILKSIIYLL